MTIPTGSIVPHGVSSAPEGYLLCSGDAVSRTTYADLYAIIGTTFGVGNGSTTFNLPDTKALFLIGAGTGSGLTNRPLGNTGGAATVALSTAEIPAHTHLTLVMWESGFEPSGSGSVVGNISSNGGTTNAGSGNAHSNDHPYLSMDFIIKT